MGKGKTAESHKGGMEIREGRMWREKLQHKITEESK